MRRLTNQDAIDEARQLLSLRYGYRVSETEASSYCERMVAEGIYRRPDDRQGYLVPEKP